MAKFPVAGAGIGWVVLVLVGAVGFGLPGMTPPGTALNWVDALFTSASAAGGVGLWGRDPWTGLSRMGWGWLVLWVHLGAWWFLWQAWWWGGPRNGGDAQRGGGMRSTGSLWVAARRALLTLVVGEAAGTLLLWAIMRGSGWGGGSAWLGAVSAACQVSWLGDPAAQRGALTTWAAQACWVPLLAWGSLAGPWWSWGRQWRRRILGLWMGGYVVTVALLLVVLLVPYVYQARGLSVEMHGTTLPPLNARQVGATLAQANRWAAAAQGSGAGVPAATTLPAAGQAALMGAMLVGGAPGSVAGGGGLLLLLWWWGGEGDHSAQEKNRRRIRRWALMWAATIFVVWWVLLLSEPYPPQQLLFETISAAGGAGLSAALAADLSWVGKLALVAAISVGRIMPLAVLAQTAATMSPDQT